MNKAKKYLYPFCLVLVGFCFSIFIAEGLVRIFFPYSREHVVPGGLFDIDEYLGWKLKAGKIATHKSTYFDVVYRINSLGFRDKPRNVSKDENVYRILLYGDSQIFGWGVPKDKRFSNSIENHKQDSEIWNLAVPGYGLDQEILSYERDGKYLNADEVIFFVSKPALERTQYNYIFKKHKPILVIDESGGLKLIPIPEEKTFTLNLFYKILSPFYLPYFLERRINILKEVLKRHGPNMDKATDNESIIPSDRLSDFEKKMLIMARNIALSRQQMITILAELSKAKRKDLEDFCDQNGIGFLEIVFDNEQDFIFGRHDSHWNLKGHKLVAEQILSQLGKDIDR